MAEVILPTVKPQTSNPETGSAHTLDATRRGKPVNANPQHSTFNS
jgi:hypothetical protein